MWNVKNVQFNRGSAIGGSKWDIAMSGSMWISPKIWNRDLLTKWVLRFIANYKGFMGKLHFHHISGTKRGNQILFKNLDSVGPGSSLWTN